MRIYTPAKSGLSPRAPSMPLFFVVFTASVGLALPGCEFDGSPLLLLVDAGGATEGLKPNIERPEESEGMIADCWKNAGRH
jgi:hypothetical protein